LFFLTRVPHPWTFSCYYCGAAVAAAVVSVVVALLLVSVDVAAAVVVVAAVVVARVWALVFDILGANLVSVAHTWLSTYGA